MVIKNIFFNSDLLFKYLIPLEEPPQLGFNITGYLILFTCLISLGDNIFSLFFRKFFNKRLLKHRAEEIAPECVIAILLF